MNKNEILNAIYSGLDVVSNCKSVKLMIIQNELYFGFIGTNSAMKVQNDKELSLYKWRLTDHAEYLAK